MNETTVQDGGMTWGMPIAFFGPEMADIRQGYLELACSLLELSSPWLNSPTEWTMAYRVFEVDRRESNDVAVFSLTHTFHDRFGGKSRSRVEAVRSRMYDPNHLVTAETNAELAANCFFLRSRLSHRSLWCRNIIEFTDGQPWLLDISEGTLKTSTEPQSEKVMDFLTAIRAVASLLVNNLGLRQRDFALKDSDDPFHFRHFVAQADTDGETFARELDYARIAAPRGASIMCMPMRGRSVGVVMAEP